MFRIVSVARSPFSTTTALSAREFKKYPFSFAGGADLGARSLHREGCEDGRAGQRQDPLLLFSF